MKDTQVSTATTLAVEIHNGNPAERILVIAPDYRVFNDWCRENGINPRSPKVWCATRKDHLRGYSGGWYVYLGVPDGATGLLGMLERLKAAFGMKDAVKP